LELLRSGSWPGKPVEESSNPANESETERGDGGVYRIVLYCWAAFSCCLIEHAFAADNGDGTYTNPPLYADFPDPDIIRVGNDFYMVSTTFVNSPGLAVLHSKDMVNWTTIDNVIPKLQGDARYDMTGGNLYRNGVFAPSIRYHNGTYYIADQPNGTSPGQGLQIYSAQDPAGPWTLHQLNSGAFDPGLFFDDNGTPYVIYGGAFQTGIFARQLNSTLTGFAGAQQTVLSNSPGFEGSHMVKRNGFYYLFNAHPSNLSMYVSRSTNLFSGWQTQQLMSDGTGSGHQGGVVDLADGNYYGFAMRDSGAVGRMTNISPVTWVNDWPVFGTNNVIPGTSPKPIQGQPIVIQPMSTGFDNSMLPPDWRWNHNPDDTHWSLTDRPGYLRLHPTVSPDLWNARNTLTYKGFGPTSQLVIELDVSNMQTGDNAGLGILGNGLETLAVQHLANGQDQLVLSTGTATATSGPTTQQATAALGTPPTVYLLLQMNFTSNQTQTAYSLDGLNWTTFGSAYALPAFNFQTGTFQGEQYAIFNYNAAQNSGFVDVNRASFVHSSDFNRDGFVDDADYAILKQHFLSQLGSASTIVTFALGDENGDLLNDYTDFRLFKADYIAANGAAAFSSMIATEGGYVPEPSTFELMAVGGGALCFALLGVQRDRLFRFQRDFIESTTPADRAQHFASRR
jgi:beta-xylosidase